MCPISAKTIISLTTEDITRDYFPIKKMVQNKAKLAGKKSQVHLYLLGLCYRTSTVENSLINLQDDQQEGSLTRQLIQFLWCLMFYTPPRLSVGTIKSTHKQAVL